MEALELFAPGESSDFAGPAYARLAAAPTARLRPRSPGYLLAAFSSGGTSLIRYAVPLPGPGNAQPSRS